MKRSIQVVSLVLAGAFYAAAPDSASALDEGPCSQPTNTRNGSDGCYAQVDWWCGWDPHEERYYGFDCTDPTHN